MCILRFSAVAVVKGWPCTAVNACSPHGGALGCQCQWARLDKCWWIFASLAQLWVANPPVEQVKHDQG